MGMTGVAGATGTCILVDNGTYIDESILLINGVASLLINGVAGLLINCGVSKLYSGDLVDVDDFFVWINGDIFLV
jgi:hypothetical protein